MNLSELLRGVIDDALIPKSDLEIKGIALDSREIKQGFVFIAVAGSKEHGLYYADQAIKNGAVAVLYDIQGSELFDLERLESELVSLETLGLKLGDLANQFYQSPSKKIDVIGVTGTNGKTTCSQFLLQLIPESGVIGTLGWGTTEEIRATVNTTPDALAIQAMLVDLVKDQKQTVIMEVSSHGLQQGRVSGISFKGALFTNLSRDHLDYHGSMEAYLDAKLLLFKQTELHYAVVNGDDPYSNKFLAVVDKSTQCWAFSTQGKKMPHTENVLATKVEYSLNGIAFLLCWNEQRLRVNTGIVGDFNLENILAVITVLLAQGNSFDELPNKIEKLIPVQGRMEGFGGNNKPYVFVDYAHTPDALEKVLKGVKKYCKGKVWVVFGCGGDRDKGKRSLMGTIACTLAEQVIITNDNPRFECVDMIIEDIIVGCKGTAVEIIQNRMEAIQAVIREASVNDCIVIAGKGHEKYQDIKGEKLLFCDQDIVIQALLHWSGNK